MADASRSAVPRVPIPTGPRVRLRPPRPEDRDARRILGRDREVVKGFGGSAPQRRELHPNALAHWWQRFSTDR